VDPLDVTRAEMAAREQMFEICHFLREQVPGFEHSQQAVWDISPTKLQTELKKNDIETI
jgi:hypothetical protein